MKLDLTPRELGKVLKDRQRKEAQARRKAERGQRTERTADTLKRNRGRVKDKTRLAWVRRLPCLGCGATRGVEAAHVRAGYPEAGWKPTGMQTKPDDARTVPLCRLCHRDGPDAQHKANERAWWAARGIYPPAVCEALNAAYRAAEPGEPIIRALAFQKTRPEPAEIVRRGK